MCLMFAYVLEIPFEIDGKRKSALGHCTCSTVDFLLSSALSTAHCSLSEYNPSSTTRLLDGERTLGDKRAA